MTADELFAKAKEHQAQADELNRQALEVRQAELRAKKVADRIVYAAYSRCPCGAGLAYDPTARDGDSPFVGTLGGYWDCSAIILGTADRTVKHTDRLPFAFYEVKSEGQPSANGATTRPKA